VPITRDAVRQLATFDSGGAPVTTCYLDVDGRRRVRPADYQAALEHLIRATSVRPNGEPAAADLQRITDYVRSDFDRGGVRGIAIFSCAARDFWEVVALPVPVHDRIHVGHGPDVAQLEVVVDDLRPIGVLLADRQRARLFVYELGELIEHEEHTDELPRDVDERGHSERGGVEPHNDELAAQHLRHAAKSAFDMFSAHRVEHVVLGGAADLLGELEQALHPFLRDRLAGRLALTATAGLADIRAAVIATEQRLERESEAAAVARLRDAIGAGRRGVGGLADTLRALSERRVEHVLVSDGFVETGWRCPACSALAAVGPDCPVCSSAMEHLDDVVAEAVQEAMAQACRVEVCVDNADLDVLGRIGALLRF